MCTGTHDFIPAADTAKLVMDYAGPGGDMRNVFYFQREGGWASSTLLQLAQAAETAWITHVRAHCSSSVALQDIEATDVSVEGGLGVVEPVGSFGTKGEAVQPANVTAVITFNTGFTGRSRRGRMYVVGLCEDQTIQNSLTTTAQGELLQDWTDFFNDVEGAVPSAHVVVSYCSNGNWRTDALVTPVAGYTMDFDLDSQRRRLNGRGA